MYDHELLLELNLYVLSDRIFLNDDEVIVIILDIIIQVKLVVIHQDVVNKCLNKLLRLIVNVEKPGTIWVWAIKHSQLHGGAEKRKCVNESPSELDWEDVSHVSINLKKFLFSFLLRDSMFFDDAHVFLIMTGIDDIRLSFDEEVELTSCFRAHEFHCSRRCVINVTSVD